MSQYRLLAAYAAGLIANPDHFIQLDTISWGISKSNRLMPSTLEDAKQLTLLGAMRFAKYKFNYISDKPYNKLRSLTIKLAKDKHDTTESKLNHNQALQILLDIAES